MRLGITARLDIAAVAAIVGALLTVLSACTPPRHPAPSEPPIAARPSREGVASWYGADFHGNRTASGERFDKDELTAAHRSLPLGSRVRVTNLANGRAAVVRITDRGPFVRGREIDVSHAAARQLGMVGSGTARVRIQPVDAVQRASTTVSAPRARTRRRGAHRRRHAAPASARRQAPPHRTDSAQAR